jgi:hypothetical protein
MPYGPTKYEMESAKKKAKKHVVKHKPRKMRRA